MILGKSLFSSSCFSSGKWRFNPNYIGKLIMQVKHLIGCLAHSRSSGNEVANKKTDEFSGCSNDTILALYVDSAPQLGHVLLCLLFQPSPQYRSGSQAGPVQQKFTYFPTEKPTDPTGSLGPERYRFPRVSIPGKDKFTSPGNAITKLRWRPRGKRCPSLRSRSWISPHGPYDAYCM